MLWLVPSTKSWHSWANQLQQNHLTISLSSKHLKNWPLAKVYLQSVNIFFSKNHYPEPNLEIKGMHVIFQKKDKKKAKYLKSRAKICLAISFSTQRTNPNFISLYLAPAHIYKQKRVYILQKKLMLLMVSHLPKIKTHWERAGHSTPLTRH